MAGPGAWQFVGNAPYWAMESIQVHLHAATDAEDSYALSVGSETVRKWRAERGYGSTFQQVWSVELQSKAVPDLGQVDWRAVLERVIEARDMNDPVIANFDWPLSKVAEPGEGEGKPGRQA